jgi:hypothetical protein
MRYPIVPIVLAAVLLGSGAAAQNLLPNPHFVGGIAPWVDLPRGGPPTGGFAEYDPSRDADGYGGSLRVVQPVGNLEEWVGVCVPVSGGATYSWGGFALLEGTTPQASSGAWLTLQFFSDGSCGAPLGNRISLIGPFNTPGASGNFALERWYPIAGPDAVAPGSAQTAQFLAKLATPLDASPHAVNYDGVYLGLKGTVPATITPGIPMLSSWGLVLLVGSLGYAAVLVLKRKDWVG